MGKTAKRLVEQAMAWLGFNEADGTHKQIIDTYNGHKPLARGYKMKYTDEWCATFVSAVAIKIGYTDIIPTECGCGEMVKLLQKMGAWIENENRTPNPGDILFYDWQDNGVGDNTGWPDHVGIVEKVENGKITVVEGNYKKGVNRRVMAVNAKNIRGYGVPKYEAEPKQEEPKPANTIAVNLPVLKKGAKGSAVKAMQILLMGYGYEMKSTDGKTVYGADESFGGATERALKKYQSANGLEADGSCGPKTWAKLLGA